MFLIDSLMISGIQWALKTVVTAAEAEMNDDTALRERLLEAEMRRETGEISDDDFAVLESDLLARIREIKERREGSGPLAFGAQPMETSPDSRFHVEASVSGDFHAPAGAAHTTNVEPPPRGPVASGSPPSPKAPARLAEARPQRGSGSRKKPPSSRSTHAPAGASRTSARRARRPPRSSQ